MRAAALVLLVALLPGLAGCGDDDDSSSEAPPTTTSPDSESEVESAYLAFWDMAQRLAESPNPDDPELIRRASGEALTDLVAGLTALRDQGRRSELGPSYRHEVISTRLTGATTAVVEDCAVDDSRIVEDATGDVVVEGVGTELIEVTLIHEDESWLVDSISQIDVWEGAVACD